MNELIEKVKAIKEAKQMSQEDIAREVGVSLNTVYRWMAGKVSPSVHVLDKIQAFINRNGA